MNERIRQLHRAKLLPAITSIAFGIALIIARKGAMDVAIKIGAVMLGLCGLGCILMYITGKVRELPQMCIGCLLLLAGVLCWIYSGVLVDIFPIITGIGLILNGLSNLAATREYSGNGGAGLIVLFSILMIAGGVLIIIYANRMVGPLMIYMGGMGNGTHDGKELNATDFTYWASEEFPAAAVNASRQSALARQLMRLK